jgi:protein-S-isoprenylcysteine O-methyltransferase Ste14
MVELRYQVVVGLKTFKRTIGWLVFVSGSSTAIVFAGGGIAFIQHVTGVVYLLLWVIWWGATAMGRQPGIASKHEERPWVRGFFGAMAIIIVTVIAPWEYASFSGPIPRNSALSYLGLVLWAAGILLQSAAMWALHGFFTVRLGKQAGHQLITKGAYHLIRHPGYLSYNLSLIGIGLALSSFTALTLEIPALFFLLWRIRREERVLMAEFGREYQDYIRKTKWRLLPWIY